jgi:hypothetical protein
MCASNKSERAENKTKKIFKEKEDVDKDDKRSKKEK